MIIGLTGASGTVGKHLVRLLEASSPDAIVVPFQGDITARDAVADYFERLGKCSALVHLAAKVSVDATAAHPETACSTSRLRTSSNQPQSEDDPTEVGSVSIQIAGTSKQRWG